MPPESLRKGAAERAPSQSLATTWHAGPPPHAGWWNASRTARLDSWRWWDGYRWSWAARPTCTPLEAARMANRRMSAEEGASVCWTWAWPSNAAVSRVPPKLRPARGVAPGPWEGVSNRVWHLGPPPHAGWWNAGTRPRYDLWRWWDGKRWSQPAHASTHAELAGVLAAIPTKSVAPIRWTTRWPRRARFARTTLAAVLSYEANQVVRLQAGVRATLSAAAIKAPRR